jgi:hypothetical protein
MDSDTFTPSMLSIGDVRYMFGFEGTKRLDTFSRLHQWSSGAHVVVSFQQSHPILP